MRGSSEAVRQYYDRKTLGFVTLGQGANLGAIHRAVWGPGVTTRDQAFHYVEDRIAELVRNDTRFQHIVDLGCGVGASLQYLAGQLPITGTGITVSSVQARLASRRIAESGLSGRVACIEGDYSNLPADVRQADLAFAIESFVHAPDARQFFAQCARLIRSGGLLVICDDFRRASHDADAERAIGEFCAGWRVNSLVTSAELQMLARDAGFVHERTTDLSSFLEIHRTRDRLISAFLGVVAWLPVVTERLGDLTGGRALQRCLARGWVGYDLAVFQRT